MLEMRMINFKVVGIVIFALFVSRFIPHPPNFTALIALSFYIPLIFGVKYISIVLVAFVLTDMFIGLHSTIFFTWLSVLVIGLLSNKFKESRILTRYIGAVSSVLIFFLLSNFGVWINGGYGYDLNGLVACYILALPFFGNTLVSTIIYSTVIEILYKLLKNPIEKSFLAK